MKKYSIEYAHIYTNKKIEDEQKMSIEILNNIINEKTLDRVDFSSVVMIDDYSFPDPSFDYQLFSNFLSEYNFSPDIIIKESRLIKECDVCLSLIQNENLKQEISSYIIKKQKYPCSLFIATWYLIRLGCIASDWFNKDYCALNLINILPESFKPFEEKGFEIIKNTLFSEKINYIENRYFLGRDI